MPEHAVELEYQRAVWDRMDGIAYPGEHTHLFGHDDSLNMLAKLHQMNRLHHAWMITGPKGIGKASFAALCAGHILRYGEKITRPDHWTNPSSTDPIASKIGKGGHPNVLQLSRPLDPKTKKFRTNLTIDEVRRTISFFGTTAGEDSWRICIVDTADDMNTNAANALLKILEEPPERTIFFLLVNSPGALLPTIRSRCRRLMLKPLGNEDMKQALAALDVDLTSLSIEQQEQLWKLSAGSVRRALVLLKQDGLKLYQRFGEMIDKKGSQQPDWPQIHKLADELSRKNKEDQYQLLFDIARQYMSDIIHASAASTQIAQNSHVSTLTNLARMGEVWEKTSREADLADRYNLDRKQVILNLFGSLAKTC